MVSILLFRFDFERLSHNLKRTVPLLDLDGPIEEGCFPKLDRMLINRSYPSRMPNQKLQAVIRPKDDLNVSVEDLKRYRDNLFDSIDRGFVKNVPGIILKLCHFF